MKVKDGITARVPRSEEHIYYEVCEEWEKITKLVLEHAIYKKMAVRDVSNYLAIFDKVVEVKNGEVSYYPYNDVKLKGCFEIDKELHKDPGMRIVPIALKEYFVNGIPIEETIKKHTDILDFCLELKGTREWGAIFKYLEDGVVKIEKLGRINRYYISGSTGTIGRGHQSDGRSEQKHSSYGVKMFNRQDDRNIKDYELNYNFYIIEANKIINKIEDRQLNLFEEW